MRCISKTIVRIFLTVVFSTSLSSLALSSTDRTVYDEPEVQPGKIIHGTVMRVDQKSSQAWNVLVKDRETGEVVTLHIDKNTNRNDISMKPDAGDNVIVKYDEQNNHAYSFLTDERTHN